jgi:DNA-binding MurR/RpiR family transcriptional regulator
MVAKSQLQDIPRALSDTLEKGRGDYESLIRQTRWGEGPIYLCGCGAASLVCLAGAYAFEDLLGWPVVVRSAAAFEAYSLSTLRPRSVMMLVSASGETPEALSLARKARARGATLLALTGDSGGALAQASHGVFLVRTSGDDASASTAVSQHAALTSIALLAARALARPTPQAREAEEDLAKLPGQIDWAFTQLSDALRSLASSLAGQTRLCVAGGGYYHAPAIRGAWRLRALAGIPAVSGSPWEFSSPDAIRHGEALMILSGSRAKAKKAACQAAAQARIKEVPVFAITDREDRELPERSTLAVLVPPMVELVASTLTLALLEWVAIQAASRPKEGQRTSARPAPEL